MIFFPKITETNSRTLDLPLPNQDIQPTKPQQSQPLVTHHKIARRAHKARALRGSITSCHPQNTKQSRKVVELPRAQESTDKLPTALRRLVNTRREHAPSHRPTSCTARNGVGAFLRPPPTGTGKPTIFPNPPPGRKLGDPADALTLKEQDAQQWEQSAATASSRSALLHPDSSLDVCTRCLQLPVTTQVIPEVTSGREVSRTLKMAIRSCRRNVASFQSHT